MVRFLLFVIGVLLLHGVSVGQTVDTIPPSTKGTQLYQPLKAADTLPRMDSVIKHGGHKTDSPYKIDSLAKRVHNPRKATLYSTFFPGLGQIYNKKYWKVPLVWAAVGIPAYTYFDNRSWYNKTQKAIAIINDYRTAGTAIPDSVRNSVDPKLRGFLDAGDDNSLRSYRNQYRKDEDYSILFFILFWGLNIVDATVDAHLASFDVSNELSFHLSQPAGAGPGLGVVMDWHKPRYKPLMPLP
jgi:hypothetical protein